VRLGEGEWTAVTGVIEGTFTKPMSSANGPIPPNGKSFKLPMATVGYWKNGTMDEEYLFYATYMSQLNFVKSLWAPSAQGSVNAYRFNRGYHC
jgi:hypothetical protein